MIDNSTAKDTAASALNWKVAVTGIDWTQPATLIVSNADSSSVVEMTFLIVTVLTFAFSSFSTTASSFVEVLAA